MTRKQQRNRKKAREMRRANDYRKADAVFLFHPDSVPFERRQRARFLRKRARALRMRTTP